MGTPADGPLCVVHVDSETGFSGGERQVFLLIEGLAARGHANRLICPPGSAAEQEARERGIPVLPLALRSDADAVALVRLARVLAAARPDLTHLHTARATWIGGLAARLAGVPAVSTRRMDRAVRRGLKTRLVHGALVRRVAAISPAVVQRLVEGGVAAERIELIRSSVDPAALASSRARDAVRAELGVAPDETVLLCAAALVPRKGVDVLLDALARIHERRFACWIAGDGPERASLEARAAELSLADRVRFLGRREDVPDLLAAADVFVLPSRAEGLGVASLEAMAVGLPVVATRVGGLGEAVVDGATGLLVPPNDAARLAEALAYLLEQPELRASLGARGPERVAQTFLADQMVTAYEHLYRSVMAETGAGSARP